MKRAITIIAIFLGLVQKSPAPMFERYSGIDELIERADVIAVVQVWNRETDSAFGLYEQYRTSILHMLKGVAPIPKGRDVKMSLRFLNMDFDRDDVDTRFTEKRFLLFLHTLDDPEVPYSSLNIQGAHWELSRFADLQPLAGLDTKHAVAYLLADAAKRRSQNATIFKETVDQALRELEATPTTDPKP